MSDPKTPPLVMLNVPPRRSSSVSVPSLAFVAKSRIPSFDLGERHPIGVAKHGHDQTFGRADGDADVVVVLQHHLVALDLGVEPRELLERGDGGLDEERRDAEARRRASS